LGESVAILTAALHNLSRLGKEFTYASLYLTAPRDNTNQPAFYNSVACFKTNVEALELLSSLQMIENHFGRERDATVSKGPRTLDLDLLLFGSQILNTSQLTIPHPNMITRRFVLEPLLEIQPDLSNPQTGIPFKSSLENLFDQDIYAVWPRAYNLSAPWILS